MWATHVTDCYSGQSTRGVPGGRVSGWGSQDQELDGNTKTQGLRQVLAAMSVIPYVLCSGLYQGLQNAAKSGESLWVGLHLLYIDQEA